MNEQLSLHKQLLDALLLDYATGALSHPLELLVETHLAMNAESAKTMQLLMRVGGVLLEDAEPVSLSENALSEVMAQIDAEDKNQNIVSFNSNDAQASEGYRLLSNYLPQKDCTKSWKRVGLGVFEHVIDFGEQSGKASIYRIAPGRSVPSHSHEGAEITLVLEGGFTDEFGSYAPGDIAIQESGSEHQPVADNDGECIVFAVNEGSVRLTGPIGRVISMLVN